MSLRSKAGAVVRSLASSLFGLGVNPGIDAIYGLSLLLVLSLALRAFLLVLHFSSLFKSNTFKFQFYLGRVEAFQRVEEN